MRFDFRKVLLTAIALVGAMGITDAASAASGFVALEGSDSTALHKDTSYTPQLFSYLQGSSTLPVLVLGTVTALPTGGVATSYKTSLSGVTLSDYSAIYIESPGGCCAADNTVLNSFGSSVNAFIAAGGNLSIENYIGGGYDGVVFGGAAAPAGSILGFGTGSGGSSCTDGEVVTALGISRGFSQPPVDGCWEHQAYESSYWEALGYQNLIASDPAGYTFADGTHLGSAFLARGGTLGAPVSGVPEPSTWAMMLIGFGVVGGAMRRGRKNSEQLASA